MKPLYERWREESLPKKDWKLVEDMTQGVFDGGPGSGNFGHAGRPGEVGGSAPGEGGGKAKQVQRVKELESKSSLSKEEKSELVNYYWAKRDESEDAWHKESKKDSPYASMHQSNMSHYEDKILKLTGNLKRPGTESLGKFAPGRKIGRLTHNEAEKFATEAPEGTKITMSVHSTGDYVGEYEKKNGVWVGSQKYKSDRVTPPKVKTANGFAMQVVGNDIEIIK